MRRAAILGVIVAVGALSAALSGQQGGGPQARTVTVQKLRDTLYVMGGGGGNSAVFVQAAGVTVVDTKNPGWGQPLLDEIRKITNLPVTTIINTHSHGDHVSGNVEFPTSVEVVTHVSTAENMKKMAGPISFPPPPAGPTIFERNQGRGMPKRTYTDTLALGTGNDRVELRYFGRAHTNGDTFVIFPALRVMHAGDAFPGKQLPLQDTNNGGSAVEYADTIAKAAAAAASANVESVITGHSTVMTVADMREFADFNREFMQAVQAARKSGQTAEQVAASWKIPARFTGYAAPQPARLQASVGVVFSETR